MSVKITVELPLEDVAAIQSGNLRDGSAMKSMVTASKAVYDAIKTLPYKVHPSSAMPATARTSRTTTSAWQNDPEVPINVRDIGGKTFRILIPLSATMSELKWRVYNQEGGFTPSTQRYIFAGKKIGAEPGCGNTEDDARTLESYGIERDSILLVMWVLRGS